MPRGYRKNGTKVIPPSNKGKVFSLEHKRKIGKSHIGMKYTRRKLVTNYRGRKHPNQTGEKHWNWKGGITLKNKALRGSLEYKLWRTAVFQRDNYTCIWCGCKKSGSLQADHIKPFAIFPELRFCIDNGRTLCIDCHRKTYTGVKKNPTI